MRTYSTCDRDRKIQSWRNTAFAGGVITSTTVLSHDNRSVECCDRSAGTVVLLPLYSVNRDTPKRRWKARNSAKKGTVVVLARRQQMPTVPRGSTAELERTVERTGTHTSESLPLRSTDRLTGIRLPRPLNLHIENSGACFTHQGRTMRRPSTIRLNLSWDIRNTDKPERQSGTVRTPTSQIHHLEQPCIVSLLELQSESP